MSKTTQYILKNFDETAKIYESILKIESEVLEAVEKQLRETYIKKWFGENWVVDKEILKEDSIYITRKELAIEKKDKGAYDAPLWIYLYVEDIWGFFGVRNGSVSGEIQYPEVQIKSYEQASFLPEQAEKVFEVIGDLKGFKRSKSSKKEYPYIENSKNLSFRPESVSECMYGDGDWDDALKPLEDVMKPLAGLDWEKIINIVKGS